MKMNFDYIQIQRSMLKINTKIKTDRAEKVDEKWK